MPASYRINDHDTDPEFSTALFAYSTYSEQNISRLERIKDSFMNPTWNMRPSGEYVDAERSYPVPMEVIMACC